MDLRVIGFLIFLSVTNLAWAQAGTNQANDPLHPNGRKLASDISAQARGVFSQLAIAQKNGQYNQTQINNYRAEIQNVLSECQKDQRVNPGYGLTLDQAAQLRQELAGISEQLPQVPSPVTAQQSYQTTTAADNRQTSPNETPGFFQRFLKHKAHRRVSTNQGLSPAPNAMSYNNPIPDTLPTPIPNPNLILLNQRMDQLNQRVQGDRARGKLTNPQAQNFLADLGAARHQADDWINGTSTQDLTSEQADSLSQQLNTIEQRISSSGG